MFTLKPKVPSAIELLVDAGDAKIIQISSRAFPKPINPSNYVDLSNKYEPGREKKGKVKGTLFRLKFGQIEGFESG